MDVSSAFVTLFSVKDDEEKELSRHSGTATVNAWNALRKRIVDLVDQDRVIRYVRVENLTENAT